MKGGEFESASGEPIKLDRMIGKGGEGEVYTILGNPRRLAKIYTLADLSSREAKVMAMVRSGLASATSLAAFPLDVVHDQRRRFVGFVMNKVDGYKPLHELYAPGARKQHFPQADYRFLVRAANNVARAFASVHATGCVVGDINHSGILISPVATAALIDTDSFQYSMGTTHFRCEVGVPEYTPPELQGKTLSTVHRTKDHDAFGLAIVIFQLLLMGRHPFVGSVRKGDIPPLHENIASFRYVYTGLRDVGMDQPPGTPALSDFSPALETLFDESFSKDAVGRRPDAVAWVAALDKLEQSLTKCADNDLHFVPSGASECAWCEIERANLGSVLFLPNLQTSTIGRTAGGGQSVSFDANKFLARASALLEALSSVQHQATGAVVPPKPSQTAVAAMAATQAPPTNYVAPGVALMLVGLLLLVINPQLLVISLGCLGGGFVLLNKTGPTQKLDSRPFLTVFSAAQRDLALAEEAWRRRLGFDGLETHRRALEEGREQYAAEIKRESVAVAEYKSKRREGQLQNFLEGFPIGHANLKGIGPAKLASLASFGIDSAAECTLVRVARVPGFGDALATRVVEWRRSIESRFVYDLNINAIDRQILGRIEASTAFKTAAVRAKMQTALTAIEVRFNGVRDLARRPDAAILAGRQKLEEARADLVFLKIPIPSASAASFTAAHHASTIGSRHGSPTPQPSGTTPTSSSGFGAGTSQPARPQNRGSTLCPRCSGSMVIRRAKRGRNAGSTFWGCQRYPHCKGTRPGP